MKSPLDSNHLGGIDLHIHSTASDGTCTPAELIRLATDIGLQAIAITDHDTLDGTCSAQEGAIPAQLRILSGVELSAAPPSGFPMGGSLHILGYGLDPDCLALKQALAELRAARDQRIPKIIERLNHIGIAISLPQVMDQVGFGSPGRPHIARVLIDMGVATDINDAFDRYLAKGQPAYVDKYRIECRRALELIHLAGGVPVLAHPYLVPGGHTAVTTLVARLHAMGLMGIEVYYPHHTCEDVACYLDLAQRFELLVTGGTDFHGQVTPNIQLGRGLGDLNIPYALYEALISRLSSKRKTP